MEKKPQTQWVRDDCKPEAVAALAAKQAKEKAKLTPAATSEETTIPKAANQPEGA